MEILLDTPMRWEVTIEKDKTDSWVVASYLITADGRRKRRTIATCERFEDASRMLNGLWCKTPHPVRD